MSQSGSEFVTARRQVLFATYIAYVGFYFCRKAYGGLKASLGAEFGWDSLQLAHLWTAFLVAYMLGQFVAGLLGRKTGPRVLLLVGLSVSIGCNVIFGASQNYATFMGFMILNGLFQACGWPGAVGALSSWLRRSERGSVMGWWSTNYQVGNLGTKHLTGFILSSAAGGLFGLAAWRTTFLACSLIAGGVWALVLWLQRDTPQDFGLAPIITEEAGASKPETPTASEGVFSGFVGILFHPTVLLVGAAYFFLKFLRYSLDSWLPYVLSTSSFQVPAGLANQLSTLPDYAGLVAAIGAGIALDRVFRGNWRVMCLLLALGMSVAYFLVTEFGAVSALSLAVLYGVVGALVYALDTTLCGVAAMSVAGEKNALTAVGVINGVGSLGPILQEEVVGALLKSGSGPGALSMLGLGVSCASTLVLLFLWLRHARANVAGSPRRGRESA